MFLNPVSTLNTWTPCCFAILEASSVVTMVFTKALFGGIVLSQMDESKRQAISFPFLMTGSAWVSNPYRETICIWIGGEQ